MCKRLVIPDQAEVERELSVVHSWWTFSARFNVGVSHSVPVARLHDRESEGVMMRWGFEDTALVPGDTVLTSDDCRGAWLHGQRGIVPLAGFYLWQLTAAGFRQPFYVRLVNRPVFGVAALWQRIVSDEDEDDVIESCALLTVPANSLLAEIAGGQMPVILHRDDYDTWLRTTAARAKSLLQPYPRERMVTHPVSPYVNSLEHDGPQLIQAIR
ncbi:MAG: SOS response-associated peptidase [Gammaproteobacteria bacterium]|nr:MAG: SOS response-associated peptidase [Gammaproteobacteria bacterium]TLY75705.1 MAG: SOS response-associated peptidase [Gammaproteobacteria bacterium]